MELDNVFGQGLRTHRDLLIPGVFCLDKAHPNLRFPEMTQILTFFDIVHFSNVSQGVSKIKISGKLPGNQRFRTRSNSS